MLDFFLVLGQVPGTRFYLTFSEVFSTYSIASAVFTFHREYHLRTNFLVAMRLNYVMYSTRVRPGKVKARAILPERIDLIPLIKTDFENFLKRLDSWKHRAQIVEQRISRLGSSLRRPADDVF
jgi:hypothetical protein